MSQTIAQDRLEIIVADDDPQSDFAAHVSGWSSGRALDIGNTEHLGLFPSMNATISRSRGEWVHIFVDDDWLDPGFYTAMEAAIAGRLQPCGMAVGHHIVFS